MCGGRAFGGDDTAVGLVEAVDLVADGECRPAGLNFFRVQEFVWDVARAERIGVAGERNRAADGADVETAGLKNELLVRVFLDRRPGRVRFLREIDVRRRHVRQADDARVVVRFAPIVIQLELLEPQHLRAAFRQPICGATSNPAEPEDDDVKVLHYDVTPSVAILSVARRVGRGGSRRGASRVTHYRGPSTTALRAYA